MQLSDFSECIHSGIDSGTPWCSVERRRVRIVKGSLKGLEGVVTERGADYLLIDLALVQHGVSVLIQDNLVEPI